MMVVAAMSALGVLVSVFVSGFLVAIALTSAVFRKRPRVIDKHWNDSMRDKASRKETTSDRVWWVIWQRDGISVTPVQPADGTGIAFPSEAEARAFVIMSQE